MSFFRTYIIPEPVPGGFVAALAIWALYEVFGLEIGFDMSTRERLPVIFFATVGVNTRLADLTAGGRVLAMLCLITVFLQEDVGMIGAVAFGLPPSAGVVIGSVALVGGHGIAIAWGPTIRPKIHRKGTCRQRLTPRRSTRWALCARRLLSTSRLFSAIWCTIGFRAWIDQAAALRAVPDYGHRAVEHDSDPLSAPQLAGADGLP